MFRLSGYVDVQCASVVGMQFLKTHIKGHIYFVGIRIFITCIHLDIAKAKLFGAVRLRVFFFKK